MCGIIGVIHKEKAIFDRALIGLLSLQHRGQDACGILTCKDGKFSIKKEMDFIHNVFPENGKELPGKCAIGHTRYATQGDGIIHDVQPLHTDRISVAHNGNITNYFDLKAKIEALDVQFDTSVDSELLLHILDLHYKVHGDIFAAAEQVFKKVRGAYAIVGIVADKGLFAIRDPYGLRPLVMGKKGDSYAFASESVAFQVMGYDLVRDIEPGEVVFIDKEMKKKSKIIKQKERAHCMFEWVYFASPNSLIEGRSVYKTRLALGKLLSKHIRGENIDAVIPVPDSGRTAAIKLAEDAGKKYREGMIKNRYISRTFIMASQDMREEAVKKKLLPIISILEDKRIAVVDDSIVRGTTSKRIVDTLKEGGVEEVTFVSSCPPIRHTCHYGIDFANKAELIASEKSIEEIRKILGADKLVYASCDDIHKAIRRNVCMACLNGEYPEPLSAKEQEHLREQRNNAQSKLSAKLNILIIGGGGREHALALKVHESRHLKELFAIPGNPGISEIGSCYDVDIMNNADVVRFAKEKHIDLVIVGPEAPLANGLVDDLKKEHIQTFGVNKEAAQFEGSKLFAREFMKKYGLPQPAFEEFTNFEKAKAYIKERGAPIVVKADGLAAGKGAFVAYTVKEAVDFAEDCLVNQAFGEASKKIVVEDCLLGEEASYHVFVDGKTYKPMVYSQDHKAIFEEDKGPNTGGMGAYSPAPILEGFEKELDEKIMQPFMAGIEAEGIDFRGILYVGLMKTTDGLKILEYNVRFGDPETQVILPRMENDIIEVMQAVITQNLGSLDLRWKKKHCVCVVASSGGYPGKYEKGKIIKGLDAVKGVQIIHAGTKQEGKDIVTNGGRVLNVVSLGRTLQEAVKFTYEQIPLIDFEGMYFRRDIAKKELDRQR